MSKEAMLTAEVAVLTELVRVLSDKVNELEAKQEQGEPVAWRYDQAKYRTNDLRGRQWEFNVFSQARPYMDEMVQNVTPLYTTPQQRTWAGLTWNDVPDEWVGKVAFMEGAKWADKQLKEKNT
jgi:hypothetical protein